LFVIYWSLFVPGPDAINRASCRRLSVSNLFQTIMAFELEMNTCFSSDGLVYPLWILRFVTALTEIPRFRHSAAIRIFSISSGLLNQRQTCILLLGDFVDPLRILFCESTERHHSVSMPSAFSASRDFFNHSHLDLEFRADPY
jgi:hypothetical protein